jgi:hypothetical protein
MAAKNFGRVNVSITASTGGLTAGLSRAGKQMKSFAGMVSSTLNPLRMLSNVARSTFGQLALFSMARSAVNTLTGMASAAAENVDVQSKLSRRLGMTYAELSGLKLAGDLAGVGIESIGAAMTKADVAMQKAAGGSKAANAAFATLGLSVDELQGMSAADRFSVIAESLSAMPTSAERAAAAVALFGRSGAQLLPLFEGGAGSIARAREEAEKFGLTLTNAQGQNVEEMNDSFTRVYSAIQGIIQQVTAYLAPAITAIAKQFTDFVGSVGGANIGQAIGEALLQGAMYLAEIGDYLIQNFSGVFQYLSNIGQQWSAVFGIGQQVVDYFYGVGRYWESVFRAVASIIAGVAGKLLTAAGNLAGSIPGWGGVGEQLTAAGESLRNSSRKMWGEALDAMGQAKENFKNAFNGRDVQQAGQAIAGPLVTTLKKAQEQARAAAAAIDQKTRGSVRQVLETKIKATVNTEALKAIVTGTSEGEAFRNSLLRGADPRNAGAEEEKRTADATEETAAGVDELVSIMRDQFALAEITV